MLSNNTLGQNKVPKDYKGLISSSWKSITHAYKRKLEDFERSGKLCVLIYDNFHILNKAHEDQKGSPFLKLKPYPILFKYIYNFLSENNFSTNEEEFSHFLHLLGKERYFTYKELFEISSIISASCIYEAGRICENANSFEDDERSYRVLHSLIMLLREKESWNFEDFISQNSRSEKTFIEHEPSFSIMDDITKNKYRETFSSFCESQKLHEKKASELLSQYCSENNTTIGELIFKEEKLPAILFTTLSTIFSLTLIFAGIYLLGSIGIIISIPSIVLTSMSFADLLMSASEKRSFCPRLNIDKIPPEGKTAVVISTLLFSKSDNDEICESLERFYLLNRDENLNFSILGDFPTGDSITPSKKELDIMEDLFSKVEILNQKYKNKFTVLVRNRSFYPDEKKHYGFERKRGAINTLIELIVSENTEKVFFEHTYGDVSRLYHTKYLFLLDSDSGIGFSTVKKAVSCALHPLNKPIIENGKVTKGYGVFQPAVKFSLVYQNQTRYQSFISDSGGIDNYESASYDRFQSIFESGVFCGKGLIDVNLYKEMVLPNIPDNAVLSHDMPEGNFLRCRLVSDLTTTDDAPTNAISYFSRLHRWIRGDVQNLIFLQNPHSAPYSDFKLISNILRHITPVISLSAIIYFATKPTTEGIYGFIFSILYLLFPFLSVLVFAPFRAYNRSTVIGRRFYSKVTGVYTSNTLRLLYEIAVLPINSFYSFDAIIKSIYRMFISKKGLLEWTTFGQSEKSSSSEILKYYIKFFINVFWGVFLIISGDILFKALGMVWILTPLILYFSSRPTKEEKYITHKEKEVIEGYAEKTWDFFAQNVDSRTNHLPPDNIQTAPTDAIAFRTSPTNIGFYLLSCLAALDFGFITLKEVEKRIENSISVIEKLEKYHGHLYNWYDIKRLSILGEKFVSTVDSGNFVTMLVALREGLTEAGLTSLSMRVDKIIKETDFSVLYNKKKSLFSIGANAETAALTENCYDLFMSEARTTSYFAVATYQVPIKHWKSLGRMLISEKGFLGMASWSGTMFEYFMSVLFLPLYKNSFSYEALIFALNAQKKEAISKLWGMSESGFYSFDSSLNYQYKAHGVPSLSLKRYPKKEMVLSPYSSFLTICVDRKASLQNLKRFKESGLWGRYGFYESVDFTNGKAIVKSYMSHHMGMSLIASANACFDDIFVNRFMRDKEMSSASDLLKERIPTNSPVYKNPESRTDNNFGKYLFEGVRSHPSLDDPKTALISSSNLDLRVSDCGHVQLLYRGVPINETNFSTGKLTHSLAVGFIDLEGNIHYTASLLSGNFKECSFEFGKNYSSHIISHKDFASSINYSISDKGDCFIIEAKSNIKRKYSPFLIFEPQMANDDEYYSGKSFSVMKTRTEFDEDSQSFFISSKGSDFTVCIQCDENIDSYCNTRDNFTVGRLYEELDIKDRISTEFSVYPLCYIRCIPLSGGKCRFFIGIGKDKNQSRKICEKEKRRQRKISREPISVDPQLFSKTASQILFNRVCCGENFTPIREELWKKGVSGDYPIYAIHVKEFLKEKLSEHIKAYVLSHRAHLKYDLFIFFDEEDVYFKKTESRIISILCNERGINLKDKSPGIHLFCISQSKELFSSKESYAVFETISNKINFSEEAAEKLPTECVSPIFKASDDFIKIDNGGFTFYKGIVSKRKPYSYVLSGESFGSVITDSSLGFTFTENSRLMKLSHYDDSPTTISGEQVYAFYRGKVYNLCHSSNSFRCKNGFAIYEGKISSVDYSLCVFVSPTKKEKHIIISFSEEGITALFSFKPLLCEKLSSNDRIIYKETEEKKESNIIFYNPFSLCKEKVYGFCSASGTEPTKRFPLLKGDKINIFATGQKILFRIGELTDGSQPTAFTIEEALAEKIKAEEFSKSFLPEIVPKTEINSLNQLFPFLFYQTAASRFYTKTGFYQNGGAFGFRDQLQDCLSLVYSSPDKVRNHLLRCACHQYKAGDVMHWWHELKGEHAGVRTECSDDYLWLPFVTAKYIKLTGDKSILKEQIPFLISEPLNNGENSEKRVNERYEKAIFTEETQSLYDHCILAIKRGYEKCMDGIPLMGSCDWNDGFSKIGNEGKGTSLFTARLLIMVSRAFSPLMQSDIEDLTPQALTKESLLKMADNLELLIEEKYFINGQYARCVSDDGTIFGIGETKACKTDILCQAFAVLGGKNLLRARSALLTAYRVLYDEKNKILRLFSPPFTEFTEMGGYINDYPPFVRENGGQYTHAAVWAAIALIECGESELGLKLLSDINPLERCLTVDSAEEYKNEPYVLSADIYSGEFDGRGGWSWYTGAASWYSVAIIEHVLGLKFSGSKTIDGEEKYIGSFKCIDVKPIIPYEATVSLGDYNLTVIAKRGNPSVLLDGEAASFPLIIPPKSSLLEVFF